MEFKAFLIAMAVSLAITSVWAVVSLIRITRKSRKEIGNYQTIIDKERENYERKESFNSGDGRNDFDNSVDIMHNFARK